MFGQNAVAPLKNKKEDDGQTLEVNSIFYTIQGEGPHAGEPAVFIRLAGCNLRCHFCDTEFERSTIFSVESIVAWVKEKASDVTNLVVLTGGEPMRQQIVPLLMALDDAGFHTQIETAGTTWPEGLTEIIDYGAVEFVCSPKTKTLHPDIIRYCSHYKYIIKAGETGALDGLPVMSTQLAGHRGKIFRPEDPAVTIWVQPCYEYGPGSTLKTDANAAECARVAMLYGYRVSLQLHKILGLE